MKKNLIILIILYLGSAALGIVASQRMEALESIEDNQIYTENFLASIN